MTSTQSPPTPSLPFGKHAGRPLPDVPSSYLEWILRECKLSSGLRSTVADELTRRGVEVAPPGPPRPIRSCDRHPCAPPLCFWAEDRRGRRRIRVECSVCRHLIDHPPVAEPYKSMADANSSPTAALDALTQLDELGISLRSNGRKAWVDPQRWREVPADLHSLVRQHSHLLGRMIGDNLAEQRQEAPRP